MEKGFTITYEYGDNLYVNTTNRCNFNCDFCLRHNGHGGSIYTHNLWLTREPTKEEILADIEGRDLSKYQQLVFCGFGEPTYRLEDALWLIDELKKRGPVPPVRINTNGHANLIHGRDVTPELAGRFDVVSISLNAPTAERYCALTRPRAGEAAWEAMLDFTRKAAQVVPDVCMTIVDKGLEPGELEACQKLAQSLGARLRVRAYIAD